LRRELESGRGRECLGRGSLYDRDGCDGDELLDAARCSRRDLAKAGFGAIVEATTEMQQADKEVVTKRVRQPRTRWTLQDKLGSLFLAVE
jgi:hypothetical protein